MMANPVIAVSGPCSSKSSTCCAMCRQIYEEIKYPMLQRVFYAAYSPVQPGPLLVYGISNKVCWFPLTGITNANVGPIFNVQCTSYSFDGAISTPVANYNNGGIHFVVHFQYPTAPFPLIGRFYFQEPSTSLSMILGGCNAPGI